MIEKLHVVCPECDTVNRVPSDRPALKAKCARCGVKLFPGRPIQLSGSRFRHHLAKSDLPLVADFWAEWCGPCRAMGPVFEEVAREVEPKARFVKINVDQEPELASEYGIRGIPALLAFKRGKLVGQRAGLVDRGTLQGWVAGL